MIRIQVSDDDYRWLMPHRILTVKKCVYQPGSHNPPIMGLGPITMPFASEIEYQTMHPSVPDRICAHESPELIAELVKEAMRFVAPGGRA